VIKAYALVNVLKHAFEEVFPDDCLLGLQFQLECLSIDGNVDYEQFLQMFFEDESQGTSNKQRPGVALDHRSLSIGGQEEYDDLLSAISAHVEKEGLDLEKIFKIWADRNNGFVTFAELTKILDLIEYNLGADSDHKMNLIKQFADDTGQGTIFAHSFVNNITFAMKLAPTNSAIRWINAAHAILEAGDHSLLELLRGALEPLKEEMISRRGDAEGRHSGITTGSDLYDLLCHACPQMSEHDKQRVIRFAVKGSKRPSATDVETDPESGLVHVYHMEEKLGDVIQALKDDATRTNLIEEDDDMTGFRKKQAEEQRRRDE
jgi:Ca2+-binding EF-hand superfamily protein